MTQSMMTFSKRNRQLTGYKHFDIGLEKQQHPRPIYRSNDPNQ